MTIISFLKTSPFPIVENNMTEIHERLQPVAEVGENGEEDSISGEETIIPLGI